MSSREQSFTLDDEDRVSPSTTFAPNGPAAERVQQPAGGHQQAQQQPLQQQSPVNFSSPMDGSVAFQGTAAGSPLAPGAMDHIRGLMGNSTAASAPTDVDAAMAILPPIQAQVIATSASNNVQTLGSSTAAPTTLDPMAAMSALSKADLLRLMEAVLHQSRTATPAAPPRAAAAPTVPAPAITATTPTRPALVGRHAGTSCAVPS